MTKVIEKIDWSKFRIRNRKDWVIFWVFAALICYAAGAHYDFWPDRWLFHFANPYMADTNQPHTWGQLIIFLCLFAVVIETVLFLCKKPVKVKILVLVGALLMPMVILAGYRIHTNLIVSSLWKEEPAAVTVFGKNASSGKQDIKIVLTEEERQEMLELCRNLTMVSDEETQELLRLWYLENDMEPFALANSIQLHFSENYGHHYDFRLRIYDGKVFLWRGYSSSRTEITFFEDNGIVEWIEDIVNSAEFQTAQSTH